MRQSLLIPILLSVTLGRAALAQSPEDMVTLEVLPGWRTDQGTQMAGLRLTLAPAATLISMPSKDSFCASTITGVRTTPV